MAKKREESIRKNMKKEAQELKKATLHEARQANAGVLCSTSDEEEEDEV